MDNFVDQNGCRREKNSSTERAGHDEAVFEYSGSGISDEELKG